MSWGWMVRDNESHNLLELCDRYPDEPCGSKVLLNGRTPTVFPSYSAARDALRRTLTWSSKREDGAAFDRGLTIIRVQVLNV